jgi:hypothetical protein
MRNKSLWEDLGFSIPKPEKEAEKFKSERELVKLGLEYDLNTNDLNKIKKAFNKFEKNSNKIHFKYFIRFFTTHLEGVSFFYNLTSRRELILAMLNSYLKNPNDLQKIHYYNLWLREGRGFSYDIKISENQLKKLVKKRRGFFVPRIKHNNGKYSEDERIFFDNHKFLLFIIKKGSIKNNTKLYVGIRIFDGYSKLFLSRKFNPIERNLTLKIAIKNKIFLDTVPQEINYKRLIEFIKDPSTIPDAQLDLIGINFEKNGVIFSLDEEPGTPQNSVNVELKKVLPKSFVFPQLRKISFYYKKGDIIKINRYQISKPFDGIIHFSLNSSRKGNEEYLEALNLFRSQFQFMPDKAYSDPNQNEEKWYKQFLDSNKFSNYKGLELPLIAIQVLNKLKKERLITESKTGALGSICYSKGCVKSGQIIWSLKKLKCTGCNNDLWHVKEEFSYEKPISGLKKYVKEKLEKSGYQVIFLSKHVFNQKIDLIKAINKQKEDITILFSKNKKHIRHLQEFAERSSNILIIECGADADSIDEPVSLKKLSEIVYSPKDCFKEAILEQKKNWKERKLLCANKSLINLLRIHNKEDKFYKGFQFEKDCFNLINSCLDNCVWLGSKDSGGKVPDGIAELKEGKQKEGCLIWDCKLSFKKEGANVGSYKKNKNYVDNLYKNPVIKSLGGLKSYIIISNNAHEKNFLDTFKKLKEEYLGDKKVINYSLLNSRQLIQIYEFIKENTKYLETNKEKCESFFTDLNSLFKGEDIKIISEKEIKDLLDKHKIKDEDNKLLEEESSFRPLKKE